MAAQRGRSERGRLRLRSRLSEDLTCFIGFYPDITDG